MLARLSLLNDGSLLAELQVKPMWVKQIRSKQLVDETLSARFKQVESGETSEFGINSEGVLCFCGRICIPKDDDLRQSILWEVHSGLYVMHPGGNKMYRNLRELCWRLGLKREVMEFVGKCLVCQKVKAEHQLPSGLLHPLPSKHWDGSIRSTVWVKVLNSNMLDGVGEQRVLGPELVANTEDKVKLIRDCLKEASDWQKSYTNLKRREIEYAAGNLVFLKVSPYPSHVVAIEEIEVSPNLTFEEEPIQIIDRDVKELRRKSVPLVKVLWRNHKAEEATWEPEEAMRRQYPQLFES
ncbi:uncharacterized protein, partial [Gossypium hirsutum]|uniref:Chromo domain-containing protein n=1 Tax=Gossypium hirsutum TaxID=3635 RepID=A0ABM3BHD0_GOSHI